MVFWTVDISLLFIKELVEAFENAVKLRESAKIQVFAKKSSFKFFAKKIIKWTGNSKYNSPRVCEKLTNKTSSFKLSLVQ